MKNNINILNPLGFWKSAILLIIPGIIISFNIYIFIPFLSENGISFFISYNFLYFGIFTLLAILSLIFAYQEGYLKTWISFKKRFWLTKMKGQDWLWILALLIIVILIQILTNNISISLSKIPFFSLPETLPSIFDPNVRQGVPSEFLDYPLKGKLGLIPVYMVFFFTNILGEQLWPRGYILPRQELKFGKSSWIINGVFNGIFYACFWRSNFISLILGFTAMSFIVQKRRNLWIGIILHSIINLIFMIPIIRGILN